MITNKTLIARYLSNFCKKRCDNDEGAALALVLIMVVVLSLWMGSVATLTQNGLVTIRKNVQNSTERAALVSGALGSALSQLTYDNPESNLKRRWGVTNPNATFEDKCEPPYNNLADYVDEENYPNVRVIIQCQESINSGVSQNLASYVLVGTGRNEFNSANNCPSTGCVTGQDGGLWLRNGGPTSACGSFNFLVSGGIINSSGAWKNIDCTNLQLPISATNKTPITQPLKSSGLCPAIVNNFSDAITSTSGQSSSKCDCPYVGTPSNAVNQVCNYVESSSLDSQNLNDLSGYLDSVMANIYQVANTASIDGTCDSPNLSSYPMEFPQGVILVNPGIITGNLQRVINTITGSNVNTDTSGNSEYIRCTNRNIPLIFKPGAFRFVPDSNQPFNWKINSGANVIGGTPNSAGNDCDSTRTEGVQLQFTGLSSISVNTGRLSLCSTGNQPVVIAPTKFVNSGAWVYDRNTPFLSTGSGNASSCVMCINAHGLFFAPGGWASLSLNGLSYFSFEKGAVFRAMQISGTGSSSTANSVSPPPPFNGDRIVQLRFIKYDINSLQKTNLGLVQIVIKDYFGRRLASGYKILNWRAAW